jgi:hypothetical protein
MSTLYRLDRCKVRHKTYYARPSLSIPIRTTRVRAPASEDVAPTLEPYDYPTTRGVPIERGFDAEFKLFGHTIASTSPSATGTLYLGVSAPMCPSCTLNLLRTRAALPGIDLVTRMPSPAAGAAGAGAPVLSNDPNKTEQSPPLLEIKVNF